MKNKILNGELFTIHKQAGKLKDTCKLVRCKSDIPNFLIDAGAVTATDDNVTMVAVEGPATRNYPVFLSWEETDSLPCGYGAWPQDNGATTLVVDEDGKCYDMAPSYAAALLVCGGTLNEHFAKIGNISIVDGECRVQTSWGEVRTAPIPKSKDEHTAVLIDYGDGGVNLLTLSEKSAEEYIVAGANGDIGKLLDILDQQK